MITHLLFDLDNTLYSARLGLEDRVAERVHAYMAAFLGIGLEEAIMQRREFQAYYGSTLEWLMNERGFTDVEDYYAAIHPADEADSLASDQELRTFLKTLNLPLAILTNSPWEHADRILRRLGIEDLFPWIFDMRWNSFLGKPHREVYCRALESLGAKLDTTLLIDDNPLCVEGYRLMGGPGLLLDEFNAHPDYPQPKIAQLKDLTQFLQHR